MEAGTGRTVILPVDAGKVSFGGGVYETFTCLPPELLPRVCVRCGADGTHAEAMRFIEDLPRRFWFGLGAALAAPALFGLGAAVAALAGGIGTLGAYAKAAGPLAAVVMGGLGLWSGRTAARRERWQFSFHLCSACAPGYRRRRWAGLALGWIFPALFFMCLALAIACAAVDPRPPALIRYTGLALAALVADAAGAIWHLRDAARFRGITARWLAESSSVAVTFQDPAAAQRVARSLAAT